MHDPCKGLSSAKMHSKRDAVRVRAWMLQDRSMAESSPSPEDSEKGHGQLGKELGDANASCVSQPGCAVGLPETLLPMSISHWGPPHPFALSCTCARSSSCTVLASILASRWVIYTACI